MSSWVQSFLVHATLIRRMARQPDAVSFTECVNAIWKRKDITVDSSLKNMQGVLPSQAEVFDEWNMQSEDKVLPSPLEIQRANSISKSD
jgi:hypothetical protein